jgi:hypothetical protein
VLVIDGFVGGRRKLDQVAIAAAGDFGRHAWRVQVTLVERRSRFERAARLRLAPADDIRQHCLSLHVDAWRARADYLDPLDGGRWNAAQEGLE